MNSQQSSERTGHVGPGLVRPCGPADFQAILTIIGEAAEAYRGAIPADCWREPYMSEEDLRTEIDRGVSFDGYDVNGELVGVMGWERVLNVQLIRHAYVL